MVRDNTIVPYLLFLPALIYLAVFIGYPTIEAFVLAFTDDGGHFTLSNFAELMSERTFWSSLLNTLLFAVIIIPIQVALALALALFVNTRFRGYLTVLYFISIPLALSDVSAALMSYTIFAPMGYLNKVLMKFGLIKFPIYFFGYTFRSREFWVIVLTEIWRATPLVFVILLAGLQTINKEYLEAADVFGFTAWQKLTKIILPLLKPSLMSALLIRTLFAFQIFGVVWILAGRDIPILAGEAYYWYAELNNPHKACVYGIVIAVVTLIVGWFYIVSLQAKHQEVAR